MSAEVEGVLGGAGEAPSKFIAPALRVEELRDEELVTHSDEDGVYSHGELSCASDSEAPKQLAEFEPPDEETKTRIIGQVEFYFSDVNILKDAFLLKHVRRNKQGYVSIKLITSFRKMKSLTKDYRVVAFSLKESQFLEVNTEGTKVKRKDPLPEYDETTPSRTVIAVNLPQENPSIETVSQLFSACGEVVLIRILRPGKSLPADVRKHVNKHPELGNTVCALVEFDTHESAQKACETLTNPDDWRKGLRVVILAPPMNKKDKHAKKTDKLEIGETRENGSRKTSGGDGTEVKPTNSFTDIEKTSMADGSVNWRDRSDKQLVDKRGKQQRFNKYSPKGDSSGYLSSGSDIEHEGPNKRNSDDGRRIIPSRASLSPKQDGHLLSPNNTPRTTPKSTPKNSPMSSPRSSPNARRRQVGKSPLVQDSLTPGTSPRASPAGSPEMMRRRSSSGIETSSSPSHSPWVQRRLKAQHEASPLAGNSPVGSPHLGRRLPDGSLPDGAGAPRMANMEGVSRQPKGPDGSPGFYGGKGRGRIDVSNADRS